MVPESAGVLYCKYAEVPARVGVQTRSHARRPAVMHAEACLPVTHGTTRYTGDCAQRTVAAARCDALGDQHSRQCAAGLN